MSKDIGNQIMDQDIEWEQTTVSGKIFARLKAAASSQGVPLSIVNKDGMMERFKFGEEEAYLLKALEGGTAGDRDGTLIINAEGWQYKRMKWWKEAIDKAGVELEYLDTPFLWVAKDAGIADYASLFSPAGIVNRFAAGEVGEEAKKQLMNSAKTLLSGALTSQLGIPDYRVIDADGGLRAGALTAQAIESRTVDNQTYQALVNNVRDVAANLPAVYANFSKPATG